MSQTRRSSILQNMYYVNRRDLVQGLNISPARLEQSILLKISVFLLTAFLTYIGIIFNAITHDQQSQSEQFILICSLFLFAACQLGLMCWLIFMIAPGVQLLFELVAWVCANFGTTFSYLVSAVFPVEWWQLLPASLLAVTAWELVANNLAFNEQSFVSLRIKWVSVGVMATVPFLSQFLTACLTMVISWLCTAAGVILVVGLRLAAVSVGIGGTVATGLFIGGCHNYRLRADIGNLNFDISQSQEPINQHEVCVYLFQVTFKIKPTRVRYVLVL